MTSTTSTHGSSPEDVLNDSKWQNMFPAVVAEKDDAAKFLVRAMFVAFSVIMKKRNLLEPKCFATNYITENIKCKTLSFSHERSNRVAQAIRSVGEAIKAGFLKEFAMVISENELGEEALEVYTFKVHYDENGVPSAELGEKMRKVAELKYKGTESVRDQLIRMVKKVNDVTGKQLEGLPDKWSFNFRVEYMPDTPASFDLDGFKNSATYFTRHPEMRTLDLGYLRPGFHAAVFDCGSIFVKNQREKSIMTVEDVSMDVSQAPESPATQLASKLTESVVFEEKTNQPKTRGRPKKKQNSQNPYNRVVSVKHATPPVS